MISGASRSEMWIQTFHPALPLFEALKQHDYPAFAERELKERQAAAMPPFSFQALPAHKDLIRGAVDVDPLAI